MLPKPHSQYFCKDSNIFLTTKLYSKLSLKLLTPAITPNSDNTPTSRIIGIDLTTNKKSNPPNVSNQVSPTICIGIDGIINIINKLSIALILLIVFVLIVPYKDSKLFLTTKLFIQFLVK